MNKKVIVFGATGTLGAHITTHLQQKGYQVYAVGHRKSDNGFFGDYNVPYYSLDIENMEQFRRLPQSGINTVLHFAGALPATMEGYTPHKYIDSIAKGTLNVLEYTRQCGAHKIIFPQSLFDISYLFGSKIPISPDAIRKAPMTGDHAIYVIAKMAAVDLNQAPANNINATPSQPDGINQLANNFSDNSTTSAATNTTVNNSTTVAVGATTTTVAISNNDNSKSNTSTAKEPQAQINDLLNDNNQMNTVKVANTAAAEETNNINFINYTVVSGDTLYSIARKFSIPVETIKSDNQLPDNTVKLSQILKIRSNQPQIKS